MEVETNVSFFSHLFSESYVKKKKNKATWSIMNSENLYENIDDVDFFFLFYILKKVHTHTKLILHRMVPPVM